MTKFTSKEQKEQAIKMLKKMQVYKPYIIKLDKDNTVTMFENYGGYYITKDNPELIKKIEEIENGYCGIVYAVTHEYTTIGELYDFYWLSNDNVNWIDDCELLNDGLAYAYVWNKTDDLSSEFGTVGIKSFGGGIKRTA